MNADPQITVTTELDTYGQPFEIAALLSEVPDSEMVTRWLRYHRMVNWRHVAALGFVASRGEHTARAAFSRAYPNHLVYRGRVVDFEGKFPIADVLILEIDRELDGDAVPTDEEAREVVAWVAGLPDVGPGRAFVDRLGELLSIDYDSAWALAYAAKRLIEDRE